MSDSVTPSTAAHQASLSCIISQSLLKFMSIGEYKVKINEFRVPAISKKKVIVEKADIEEVFYPSPELVNISQVF